MLEKIIESAVTWYVEEWKCYVTSSPYTTISTRGKTPEEAYGEFVVAIEAKYK